jgi:hypothetical protein
MTLDWLQLVENKFGDRLVFLLEEESTEMEKQIRAWAMDRGVMIRIEVSGPFALLNL